MPNTTAPGKQEIFNMALGHISVAPVSDINEGSRASDACNLYWVQAVRDTIRSNKWPFATSVILLSQSATYTPVGWIYAYVYPANCIKMWYIYNVNTNKKRFPRGEPFTEVYDATNNVKILCTNCADAYGEYVIPVEDTTIFDSMFVTALSLKLASLIAPSLVNDDSKTIGMLKLFTSAISEAQRSSSEESPTDENYQQSAFIDARGGSSIDVKFQNGYPMRP